MADLQIQYARTSDGVSIAYCVMGEGPPLVYLPPLPQHPQLEWQIPDVRRMYEWLTARHQVVRIDARNTGLSQRGEANVSLEARQWDVEAVVDRLQLGRFTLFAHGVSGPTAVAVAAHHPDRVTRLILVNATVAFADVAPTQAPLVLRALLEYDWETYTRSWRGWSGAGLASRRVLPMPNCSGIHLRGKTPGAAWFPRRTSPDCCR